MAQNCGFFNAQYQDGEYDRVYNAEQFAAYFASFIGTGIFGDQMEELLPMARTENNMSVNILSGRAWINGWWYENDETLNLPIAIADGVLNRKDIIVLRWGNSERDMWIQVIQGEPSVEAVAPVIRRDADYYDLELCEIDIPAGTTKITQSLIHDTRLDNNVCGLVTGVVDQIDTTALYLQFNAQFNTWFEALKEQFSGDVPGMLQDEIDAINDNITATYGGDDIPFKFGIDPTTGDYGYIKAGADTVTPFKSAHTETITPVIRDMIDMGVYHKVRYVDLSAVPNIHTETYRVTTKGQSIDMGETHNYRYINSASIPNSNAETYTLAANETQKDLGETNTYRYIVATNVYNAGVTAGGNAARTEVSTFVRNRVAYYNSGVSGWGNINSQADANNYVDVSYNQGVVNADARANPNSVNYQSGYNAGKAAAVPAYYSIAPAGQQTYYYNGGGTTVNGGCKITLGAATISRNGNVLTISIPESIYSYGGYENQGVTTNRNITLTCTM